MSGPAIWEEHELFPFAEIDPVYHGETFNIVGHRMSSPYSSPVSIRNFLAGHVKKSLRTSVHQNLPAYTDILLRLPIELGLVVFEHLHPIDLYHMAQVSEYFRHFLLDKKLSGVWEMAFRKHKELPACPPGTSYYHWSFLLFGPGVCTECGRDGALTDFSLRQKHCQRCMDKKSQLLPTFIAYTGKLLTKYDVICSMVSCSFRITSPTYTFFNPLFRRARCIISEVQTTMKHLALLQILIASGLTSLTDILEDYKAWKIKSVKAIKSCTDRANSWAIRTYRSVLRHRESSQRRVVKLCSQKFLNLGHDHRDVDYCTHIIAHSVRISGIYKLTPKAFRKIRPELEEHLLHRMKTRIQIQRRGILQALYEDYQSKLDPGTWLCLPPSYLAPDDDGFKDLLDQIPDDVPLDALSSSFDKFVSNWTRLQQLRLLEMISNDFDSSEEQQQLPVEKLEIAGCVFSCRHCSLRNSKGRVLIGWEGIASHLNQPRTSKYRTPCSKCKYSEFLSALSKSVVASLGLDPLTTTRQEMDGRGDRFLCAICEPFAFRGNTINLKAYTWIEYLRHHAEMRSMKISTHILPSWKVLTRRGADYVRAHEPLYPLPNWKVWRCNRCSVHFSAAVTRTEAIAHVLNVHFHEERREDVPVTDADIAPDKRCRISRRKPFVLKLNSEHNLKCSHCPELPILKVWNLQSLENHLILKHAMHTPAPGVDWTSVNFIEGTFSLDTY